MKKILALLFLFAGGFSGFAQTPLPQSTLADTTMLESSVLVERMKLVEVKMDKIVFNVRESAFAQGSDALELLKKAPGVTVDKDGNVKLNGKGVSVWIDGRPTNVDGKSLEALLRGTGGDTIDKFELMEHPSAKYDAAGQGGIINIKTRRNFRQGLSGTLGLGGGGMYFKDIDEAPLEQNAWANVAWRTPKTNVFLNVREETESMPILISNELSIPASNFSQTSETLFTGLDRYATVKFGGDWFIDDRNTVGAILNVPVYSGGLDSKYSWSEQYIGGSKTSGTVSSISNGPMSSVRHSLNLNYTHVFDEATGSEITANLDYVRTGDGRSSRQTDTTVAVSAPGTPVFSRQGMDSDQLIDIWSAKADWQGTVWKKFMMESGAKWALSQTGNNSVETSSLAPDLVQDFTYREHIAAAYASLAGQLGPKFSFKAGLRGEYTNSFGDWTSGGTRTRRSYFDLFPTVFAGCAVSDKLNLNLSYSRRINRPHYEMLNPTKLYIDANTYTLGDPDLLPQYSDDVSLSAMLGQHLSWSLTYDYSSNLLNQIISCTTDGLQYMKWGNYGTQNMGVASFNVSALPIGKWLQCTFSANALYLNSRSDVSDLVRSSFGVQGYTDLSFVLPKDWRIDLDAFYSSPMVFGAYDIHSSWSSDLAAKKSLMEGRMSLALKLNDIFRTNAANLDIHDESGTGAVTAIRQKYYYQNVVFDLTWSFGKAQKPARQRNVGNLEETSRIGGSGSGGGIGK